MTHFDDIYEVAADNYGLVTFAEAREAGTTGGEPSIPCGNATARPGSMWTPPGPGRCGSAGCIRACSTASRTRIPPGMFSTLHYRSELWIRSVSANPEADIQKIIALLDGIRA